jgi:phage terminase large subunit-like protein
MAPRQPSPPADFAARAEAYAWDAEGDVDGRKFCKWARLAARRHLDDLQTARVDPRYPYEFVPWHANDVCEVAELLPHVEGSWDAPTIRLEPAQIFWLACLFGWRRKSDGNRRFSMAYLEVARKNAKSTLAAVISIYCLCYENENGPQILLAATTGQQADKVFQPARRMVQRTAGLREAWGLQAFARSVYCGVNGGVIQPINAKANTQDGWNPHLAVLDELHAHKDRGLFDVVRSAFGARKNPLLFQITTAGHNHMGVCYEQRSLLTKILEGVVKADHYWGIIYTLDDADEENGKPQADNPFDPTVWIKANPLLGVSIRPEEIEGYAIEAQNSGESAYEFKTKRCNLWLTARGGHVNIEKWRRCSGVVPIDDLGRVECYGGLDLASTADMCAFRLVWRIDGRTLTWGRFYLPEAAIRPRSEKADVPYRQWQERGLLRVTEGDVTDYAVIERDIVEALDRFQIMGIGYDPWNASDLVNRLSERGAPMVEFRQGARSFNAPMKELDRAYLAGMLDHGGDEVLTWNASNVVAQADDNMNIKPSRRNSQEKIDGYVALLMALGVAMSAEPALYADGRGLLTL